MSSAFEHVVLDTGAVIACSELQNLGKRFYSTSAVLAEIKDQAARQRLQLLPDPVQIRQPSSVHVQRVISMAKTSGDFGVLSMADIGIVALALELMEEVGCPPVHLPGEAEGLETDEAGADDEVECCSSEEDEETGWVTKDNLAGVLGNAGSVASRAVGRDKPETLLLACASVDFAVQNVCAKFGIRLLSPDARLITEIRTHVLWCAGCLKRCLRTDKRFCPACGNATLHRVTAQLDSCTGKLKMYFRRNYQYRLKGTRYSLPRPRGGKHSLDPIVSEFQRVPQQLASQKALRQQQQQLDIDDPELKQQAFAAHDLCSRAAALGIKGGPPQWSRRNPNEPGPRTGNKKRRK